MYGAVFWAQFERSSRFELLMHRLNELVELLLGLFLVLSVLGVNLVLEVIITLLLRHVLPIRVESNFLDPQLPGKLTAQIRTLATEAPFLGPYAICQLHFARHDQLICGLQALVLMRVPLLKTFELLQHFSLLGFSFNFNGLNSRICTFTTSFIYKQL